jgi:hypothetical protein
MFLILKLFHPYNKHKGIIKLFNRSKNKEIPSIPLLTGNKKPYSKLKSDSK